MPRKVRKYQHEDLVWAKKEGYAWPGKVSKSALGERRKGQYFVFFFGTFHREWVKAGDIVPYIKYVDKYSNGLKTKKFKLAVSLMAMLYAELFPKKETVSYDHEMSSAEEEVLDDIDEEIKREAIEVDHVEEKEAEPQRRTSQRLSQRVKVIKKQDYRKEKKGGKNKKIEEKCEKSAVYYPSVYIWDKAEICKLITKNCFVRLRRYHD